MVNLSWRPNFDFLQSPLLLLIRLFWGWQFFQAGKGKLADVGHVVPFFQELHIPFPQFNAYLVGTVECFGGLCLLLGLASRLVAIPLTITMLVAFLTADLDKVRHLFSDPEAFTSAAPFLFLLVTLIVMSFGPGKFSMDWLILKSRGKDLKQS